MRVREHRVVAHNTASMSANKIHDDAVARDYGFDGGLVPGVDVYAYMTRPPVEAWGIDWLRHGSMRARFMAPVYEGDEVAVVSGEVVESPNGRVVSLEVHNRAGAVCAVGEAGLPAHPPKAPPIARWPKVAPAVDPPTASPSVLTSGTALALAPHRFHAERAHEYLAEVRETLPLYAEAGVAHPGWLLRDANYVLSTNLKLGPWIHVESVAQHHAVVHDGDTIEARATVTKEWERRGHRFVELDVGLFTAADHSSRVAAHVTHIAIYRPGPHASSS
jgi:acyl dehydratase